MIKKDNNKKNQKNNQEENGWLKKIISEKGVFDLQFRREIKYNRLGRPIYYRWISQFIITTNNDNEKEIENIKRIFGVGKIYKDKKQPRYIIQNLEDSLNVLVPFLKKELLNNDYLDKKRKEEINLWIKANEILFQERNKKLINRQKQNFQELSDIYKKIQNSKGLQVDKEKWEIIEDWISSLENKK